MKKAAIPGILFLLILSLQAAPLQAKEETYQIDPVHSFACFKVGHLGISFVRGRFTDISGTIAGDRKNPEKGQISVEIKTASIDTGVPKRDEDLKSDTYLDVKRFPTMSFKSTRMEKRAPDIYEARGDFTLHGVTRPIKLKIRFTGEGKDPWGGFRAGGEALFTIRRSDYGMGKSIPAVGDSVTIELNFEGIRK